MQNKRVIIVGSGAGGAAAAAELQKNFNVTILEAGKEFRPFKYNLSLLGKFRWTGLFFDERLIELFFPAIKIKKSNDMILVYGKSCGGTTPLSTGNALRADGSLKNIGIDLDQEFEELYRDIPVSTEHETNWSRLTKDLYKICKKMSLNPFPSPKMGNYHNCSNCGHCIMGCPRGIKWDSRQLLNSAIKKGANLLKGCQVEKVVITNNKAEGVMVKRGKNTIFYPADIIVLAAGGLGTPVILEKTGIKCRDNLFVDPVLCVAGKREGSYQNKDLPMPFILEREGYIISPYFDHFSFFFDKNWRYKPQDIVGIMIKLADSNKGGISSHGIRKDLTERDKNRLQEGVEICQAILKEAGIGEKDIFTGMLNAGHPGGMFPLTAKEKDPLHNDLLPVNLYIADSTLLPKSSGKPPILTIMAVAKRVSKIINKRYVE